MLKVTTSMLLASMCIAGCHRTVVRTNAPAGQQPAEVTISSPGTAATKQPAVTTAAPTQVVAVQPAPPPPPPPSSKPESPGTGYAWVPGAYDWDGSKWQWSEGHWAMPTVTGATWEPGHWEAVPGGWRWQPGRWR